MSSCVGSGGRHPSLPLLPHLLPPWEVVASSPEAFPGPGRSPHPHLSKSLLVPQGADDEGHEAALHEPAQGQLGTQGQEVPDLIQIQGAVARDRDEGCVRKHEWVSPPYTEHLLRCWVGSPGPQASLGSMGFRAVLPPTCLKHTCAPEHVQKHTVRYSGGPSAKDRGLQGLLPKGNGGRVQQSPRPWGTRGGGCSPSRSLSITPAASSGVRQRNSLAGSVWRRWRPGDPGIPDGRCRAEGFRQWTLSVDILDAAATRGSPASEVAPVTRRVPPHLLERGDGQGAGPHLPGGRPGQWCLLPLLQETWRGESGR